MQCPNPACLHPDNPIGRRLCDRCQTPLVYHYLWAVGDGAEQIATGATIDGRYVVVSPRIWLETKPGKPPDVPPELADATLPYLRLYPYRVHLPEVYGVCRQGGGATAILLLSNSPIDAAGQPYPSIGAVWEQVSPLRRLYWLWQLFQLWGPMRSQGVASSLLAPNNLRVEGWRVRLREFYVDPEPHVSTNGHSPDVNEDEQPPVPTLSALAGLWLSWVRNESTEVAQNLRDLCQSMQQAEAEEIIWKTTAQQLNLLLLKQAAEIPLYVTLASATTTGPQRTHNEDACYPNPTPLSLIEDVPLPGLGIVCDGIGGHAGGEVASQLALRSLQLQMRALLLEVAEQSEVTPPEIIMQQLAALTRVVNNTIAAQNDEQGRELRQRMGTTLVLALQLPQKIIVDGKVGNSHELYLAHVGDSRAYWITPQYCHLLTLDDDVTAREIRTGRSVQYDAQRRSDAGALTQALGTRDGETLYPTVQRFILDEDGVLLLCSDGLSDNDLVERSWEQATRGFFKGKASLNQMVQTWLAFANEQNGHDNTTVVAMHCRVSQDEPALFTPEPELPGAIEPGSQLSEASRALLYDEDTALDEVEDSLDSDLTSEPRSANILALAFGLLVLLLLAGGAGLAIWNRVDPAGFNQTWQRLINPSLEQPSPRP
jgi:protein phosphatase